MPLNEELRLSELHWALSSLQDHWILNGPFDRGTDWDLF